jgi:hypothetical protein
MNAVVEIKDSGLDFGTKDGWKLRKGASASIEVGDFTIRVNLLNRDARYYSQSPKVKVFVWGEEEVDFTAAHESARDNDGWSRGVHIETDKMFDSLNRKVVKNKKALVAQAVAESELLQEILGDAKLGWWKTAGCSCPCSPGFIAEARPFVNVTVEGGNYTFNEETEESTWTPADEIRKYAVGEIFITKN